jgi:hypothetical protein
MIKKKKTATTLIVLSLLTALIFWVVSNLKTMSNLDIFKIEEE